MKTEYTLKKTLSLTMAHCNGLWSLDRSATHQEPSRQNGNEGEQSEAGERRDQGRRHHVGRVKIDPAIEVEHVDTALGLVAAGAADTIVPQAIVSGPGFPKNIKAVPFAEPLYDTIALIQREAAYLSPATRKMAQMAERTLLAKVAPEQNVRR